MSEETSDDQKRGLLRLFWGIITRPRATLEYLNEHGQRTWWVPALLALLAVILPIVVAGPITTQRAREEFLAVQEQMQEQIGEAEMEQAMSIVGSPLTTTVFPAVLGLIGRILGWLVWAGALYLTGMALGGRSSFGHMLRTVVWAWTPYTLRGLLQTVYILASGQIIANPGLSGFVRDNPSAGQMLLASLLGRVDIYLFWNLALLVTGVAVSTRLPGRKAALVTLGMWVLLTAIGLIPALVGGFFAQRMTAF